MDTATLTVGLLLTLAVTGAVVGFLVGLTGVGAGALTTPLLITGFGVPAPIAVGTDLIFAAVTKAGASWRHSALGHIDWGVLLRLGAGSVTGASLMLLYVVVARPDTVLLTKIIGLSLAVALVVSAAGMIAYPYLMQRHPVVDDTAGEAKASPTLTMLLGFVIGALVSLTSVGAGAIGVVALTILYPAMSARRIVGTDIAHAVPLTLLAGLGHASLGNVDVVLLATLLVGSIPGTLLGSRFAGHIPERTLRIVLALVLVLAAVMLVVKAMR
ncbi:MAG: sulfite exporter TauE/SafE family protein [Hyphomicrobiaceae bacterium]|nr:sulfite exporter TauE/SafE family protein [Hyphomicrobiaceae bacterium]